MFENLTEDRAEIIQGMNQCVQKYNVIRNGLTGQCGDEIDHPVKAEYTLDMGVLRETKPSAGIKGNTVAMIQELNDGLPDLLTLGPYPEEDSPLYSPVVTFPTYPSKEGCLNTLQDIQKRFNANCICPYIAFTDFSNTRPFVRVVHCQYNMRIDTSSPGGCSLVNGKDKLSTVFNAARASVHNHSVVEDDDWNLTFVYDDNKIEVCGEYPQDSYSSYGSLTLDYEIPQNALTGYTHVTGVKQYAWDATNPLVRDPANDQITQLDFVGEFQTLYSLVNPIHMPAKFAAGRRLWSSVPENCGDVSTRVVLNTAPIPPASEAPPDGFNSVSIPEPILRYYTGNYRVEDANSPAGYCVVFACELPNGQIIINGNPPGPPELTGATYDPVYALRSVE